MEITDRDEILRLARSIFEIEMEEVLDKSFVPKFIWYDDTLQAPRLCMFPQMERGASREAMAFALRVIGSAIESETLAFVNDAYQATQMTKKDGSRWGRHEMQDAVENNTEDAELVFEAFCVTLAREGWCAIVSFPYDRSQASLDVRWDDVKIVVEGSSADEYLGGSFPEMMREAVVVPKVRESMPPELGEVLGLDEERQKMHTLCAGVKHVMASVQMPCAIPAYSDVEREVLASSFSDAPFKVDVFEGEADSEGGQ